MQSNDMDENAARSRNGHTMLRRRVAVFLSVRLDTPQNWPHSCYEFGAHRFRHSVPTLLSINESLVGSSHRIVERRHIRPVLLDDDIVRKHCGANWNRSYITGIEDDATTICHSPPDCFKNRNFLQGLVGAIFEGVGVSTGSFIGGIMFERIGGSSTFRIYGIAVLVFCVIHIGLQKLLQRTRMNGKDRREVVQADDRVDVKG